MRKVATSLRDDFQGYADPNSPDPMPAQRAANEAAAIVRASPGDIEQTKFSKTERPKDRRERPF